MRLFIVILPTLFLLFHCNEEPSKIKRTDLGSPLPASDNDSTNENDQQVLNIDIQKQLENVLNLGNPEFSKTVYITVENLSNLESTRDLAKITVFDRQTDEKISELLVEAFPDQSFIISLCR